MFAGAEGFFLPKHSDSLSFRLTKPKGNCQRLLKTISMCLQVSVDLLSLLCVHLSPSLLSKYRFSTLMIYVVTMCPLFKK